MTASFPAHSWDLSVFSLAMGHCHNTTHGWGCKQVQIPSVDPVVWERTLLTLIQITVNVQVGDVFELLSCLIMLLQEGWQAVTEQALDQLHILAHFWQLPFQTVRSLFSTQKLTPLHSVC